MRPLIPLLLTGCHAILGFEDPVLQEPEPSAPDSIVRCSTTHSFSDDFEGALHPFWSVPPGNPAIDNGALRFAFPDFEVVELATGPLFDFRGSSFSAEVIAPADIGDDTVISFRVDAPDQRVPQTAPRRIELRLTGTELEAVLTLGNGFMTVGSATYDPALHRFWQLAEDAGEVVWSTSIDGRAYRELARVPVAGVVTVRPRIEANRGESAPTDYQLRIDNVNAGVEPDPICGADTLQESFDGELDPYVWTVVDNATVVDGSVVLRASFEPDGATGSIHPGGLYDLEGSGVTVEIPRIDFADETTVVTVIAEPIGGGDNFVAFHLTDMLTARTADEQLASAPYDPETQRFLRLRADHGTVIWEVSADGVDFALFAQTTGHDLRTVLLSFDAVAASSIDVELAGINAP